MGCCFSANKVTPDNNYCNYFRANSILYCQFINEQAYMLFKLCQFLMLSIDCKNRFRTSNELLTEEEANIRYLESQILRLLDEMDAKIIKLYDGTRAFRIAIKEREMEKVALKMLDMVSFGFIETLKIDTQSCLEFAQTNNRTSIVQAIEKKSPSSEVGDIINNVVLNMPDESSEFGDGNVLWDIMKSTAAESSGEKIYAILLKSHSKLLHAQMVWLLAVQCFINTDISIKLRSICENDEYEYITSKSLDKAKSKVLGFWNEFNNTPNRKHFPTIQMIMETDRGKTALGIAQAVGLTV